jgi:MFS family permease
LCTIACGLARTYLGLVAFRLLVGVGEAGGSPTSQALITDYTSRERRAGAIAIYTLGIPLGSLLGLALGGLVLDRYGWRAAFIVAGAPGLVVALLAFLSLKEPRAAAQRRADPRSAPPLGEALKEIFSKRSFVLLTLGGSLVSFVNYAIGAWAPAFFFRAHAADLAMLARAMGGAVGVKLGPAGFLGVALGVSYGLAGVIGTLVGGWLTDRMARRDFGAYVTVQVVFTLLRLPCRRPTTSPRGSGRCRPTSPTRRPTSPSTMFPAPRSRRAPGHWSIRRRPAEPPPVSPIPTPGRCCSAPRAIPWPTRRSSPMCFPRPTGMNSAMVTSSAAI